MNYSKKNMKKKQNFGNASRKIYKKNHRRLRKSAKNKHSTNLLFKTVKLYEKQKHKYLDKPKIQRQLGGTNPIFKGGKSMKISADEIKDRQRRKNASQNQVIKKLLRDLKRNNVSNLVRNYKNAKILVSHKIYSFDDLSKYNSNAIGKLINSMKMSSKEADKFKKLISSHKHKHKEKQEKQEKQEKKQSKKSVKNLLLEINALKNKLSNVQLAMQNMKSHTGTPVCFDATSADVKGKDGKTEKGTTVRVCVNTKKSLEQWAKSISKGSGKDRVITGNDITVKAEAK
tara:strand:- start:3090 stop:3947 length:858 start_codon:yes stop_codon:yes gene_type:complete